MADEARNTISMEEFEAGEEKRPEGGPSFRGSVLNALSEEEGMNVVAVVEVLRLNDSNAKTKVTQALNNLYRDKKVGRRYVDKTAYFIRTENNTGKEEAAE